MTSCRLCLKDFLLVREDFNIQTLKNKLESVFTFEIKPADRLSSLVCPECVETVCNFYDFACMVDQNQLQLKNQTGHVPLKNETSTSTKSHQILLIPEEEIKIEYSESIPADPIDIAEKVAAKKSKPKDQAGKFEKNLISRHLDMVCDICQEDQFTYQKLDAHFKKYHRRRCYISCCGQKLTNEAMISNHLEKHTTSIKSKEMGTSSWERRIALAFGSILVDFKKDLEGYEPLPNMELALKGNTDEQQKMYGVQDYLVQTYFNLNCEFCNWKVHNQDERRMHFRQYHPKEKYFVSCCGQRFSIRISIMRHLNRHWKHVAQGTAQPKSNKVAEQEESSESSYQPTITAWQRQMQSAYSPLIIEFRDDLFQGGFTPPLKVPETKSPEQLKLLHQMQDFLIGKHCPLNCELCGVEISTYAGRREHFRIGHPKEKLYVECCGKKLPNRQQIITHLIRHRKGLRTVDAYTIRNAPESMLEKHEHDDALIEGYYKMDCELCPFSASSYLGLRAHFKEHHREEGFFITCCQRRFKTKFHILEHIATHQRPGSLKCEHCEATFTSERMRKVHASRKHASEDEKIYKCDHCVESFATKNLLVLHAYKHEEVKCDICGAEMKRCSLRVHKLNIHKLGEEVVCHVCAKVFHSKHMFNAHYRMYHLGIRKKYKKKSRAKKRAPPAVEVTTPVAAEQDDELNVFLYNP